MTNKIFPLLILVSFISLAQGNKQSSQNVELPDFVITGNENVAIQNAKKIPPDFISTVPPNFLKPVFSPEELEMKDISNPVKNDITIFDSLNYIKGILEAGVGIYTLPKASLKIGYPIENGLVDAFINADNKRAHVDFSDWYTAGAGGNLTFFVNENSSFLPGSKIRLHGDYKNTSFRYYASAQPLKRSLGQGILGLDFENYENKYFNFGASIYDHLNDFSVETFSENNFLLTSFAKINLQDFFINVNLNYKYQSLKTDSIIKSHFSFFEITPTVGFSILKNIRAAAGINYNNSAGASTDVFPYASMGIKFTNEFSLFAEYFPRVEFLTAENFFNQNRYFNPQTFLNVYHKKPFDLNAVVKYEYDKYYQINLGAEYYTSKNYPYFVSSAAMGRFDVRAADGNTFRSYLDLLFHLGPNGIFYGSAELNRTVDDDGNTIPYAPHFKMTLNYGYEFNFGFVVQPKLIYFSSAYTDIKNTTSLKAYADLGLKLAYKFTPNFHLTFELNNLINKENFLWRGYKEFPLDAIAGLVYQW